jgi:hypothetical protein
VQRRCRIKPAILARGYAEATPFGPPFLRSQIIELPVWIKQSALAFLPERVCLIKTGYCFLTIIFFTSTLPSTSSRKR